MTPYRRTDPVPVAVPVSVSVSETQSKALPEDVDSPSHTSLLTVTRFLEALGQQAHNEPYFTALR